ncbi:uncharacterized protein ColSpa_08480 [Colletotrichum spaethianum]|uniref:Uncharacterized protein n=1 Tax=Colletotrichum spaethianum TaxID=700344 RepID=A0AA37UIN0_9PEZI|nr:uncharacterized protein ColSpa_08480 [Colletotrichum spaethianum]GKT48299.1 hypothetical protein ColSpa_08480 [Colletotrichum spaethianum]
MPRPADGKERAEGGGIPSVSAMPCHLLLSVCVCPGSSSEDRTGASLNRFKQRLDVVDAAAYASQARGREQARAPSPSQATQALNGAVGQPGVIPHMPAVITVTWVR